MTAHARILAVAFLVLATAAVPVLSRTTTQRPGIDRPIRVGMFKGTGTGSRYWHTNIHTANAVIGNILANPANAGLGPNLSIPPMGFTFYSMPVAPNTAGTAECTGGGCGPTPEQLVTIVASLDTLDIILMNSVTEWSSRVSNTTQRQAFADFWTFKGYVAIHTMTETLGFWAPMDTIHGARFRGQTSEQPGTIRRDSVFEDDPSWQYLNRGVFSNGLDTTIYEEWLFFTQSAAGIRSSGFLRPTMKLDESSIANPGSQTAMGDHPMSWYKQLPTGGRFFYTALGHRADTWENARTFRRQLYNAILWTAKYDSLAQTVSIDPGKAPGQMSDHAHVSFSGGALTVSLLRDGAHTVEILALDGRRVDARRGSGRVEYALDGLRRGAVYIVAVTMDAGRHVKRMVVP